MPNVVVACPHFPKGDMNNKSKVMDGVVRFADAPEVARTAERGVTLTISAEEARQLPPPDKSTLSFRPRKVKGRLGRMFGGSWKRQ